MLEVGGLFAGIGGIEQGLKKSGCNTNFLCEIDPYAQEVLKHQFKSTDIISDIRDIDSLPKLDILTAGFPCQDLSPAGKTVGINGGASGLIDEVFRILRTAKSTPNWLLIENVPFMLQLQKGKAIEKIASFLENEGWNWAYRIIDTRAFGIPQRRRRVILLASQKYDPRPILLGEKGQLYSESENEEAYCGFYWTEGNRGVGWAKDAIPTIKGSTSINIPSPPAIWLPKTGKFILPSIEDAERLQGFRKKWTKPAEKIKHGERARWKLVGNAVSVPVSHWLGNRIINACEEYNFDNDKPFKKGLPWPKAAWSFNNKRFNADVTEFPKIQKYTSLERFLTCENRALSYRASRGFYNRITASTLKTEPKFIADLKKYVQEHADA